MPASSPRIDKHVASSLEQLGEKLKTQRKTLGLSAAAVAASASMSRVTLHRIERGEPSVTIGAYLNVMAALGLEMSVAAGSRREKRSRD